MATRPFLDLSPDLAAALRGLSRRPKKAVRRVRRRSTSTTAGGSSSPTIRTPAASSASARIITALVNPPDVAPRLRDVLTAAGVAPTEAAAVVKALENRGQVELWPDPPHGDRIMLSRLALARLGLVLAPDGRRWMAV